MAKRKIKIRSGEMEAWMEVTEYDERGILSF